MTAAAACLVTAALAALAPQARAEAPLQAAAWAPRVGAMLSSELAFTDSLGHPLRLGEVWRDRPALLVPVYYHCPNLCDTVLTDLGAALAALPQTAGRDFEVVAVSIDPAETPAQAEQQRQACLQRYGRPGTSAGWRFLVGQPRPILQLTAALGFGYACDPASHQFSHPAGLVAVSAGGRVSGYVKGVGYEPVAVAAALADAAAGREGSVVGALLRCFHYAPVIGRYGPAVAWALQGLGVLTVTTLAALVAGLAWRDGRREAEIRPDEENA